MTDSRTNVKVDGFAMEWTHARGTSIVYMYILYILLYIFCHKFSHYRLLLLAAGHDSYASTEGVRVTKFEEGCVVIRQDNVFKEERLERTKTRKKRKTNNTWPCRSEIYNAIGLRRYAVTRTAAIA